MKKKSFFGNIRYDRGEKLNNYMSRNIKWQTGTQLKQKRFLTNFDYVRVANAKCKYGVYEIPEHHQCLLLLTFII